jgi:Xaa-Pro aminopeptidase
VNADLYSARRRRAELVRARLVELELDALLLSLGADLPWLTGYEAMPLERPTLLVFPADGEPTLVVAALEAARVDLEERLFSMRRYLDGDDPIDLIAGLVGGRSKLAISPRAWASLLLDLEKALTGAQWSTSSDVTGPIRAVKDEHEQAALEAAGGAADRVAAELLSGSVRLAGRSELEVSREISDRLLAEGNAKVNFAIVGSGPNSASPHHEPGARVIQPGDAVVCDFGGTYRLDGDVGYCSDITRTVVIGEPSSQFRELYAVLEIAQRAGLESVKVGARCEDVDKAARHVIEDAGFGEAFIHRTGHGIGVEEHEDPYIVEGNVAPLVSGNAFSVEPGIYLEGVIGARIEDIVIATEAGMKPCNSADHALVVLDG